MEDRKEEFRSGIAGYIAQRRDAKVKDGELTPGLTDKYEFHTWLHDAARRAPQLRLVTHVLKATHPDAKGTNPFAAPAAVAQKDFVGTHSLGNQFARDVVGNAAALDVYGLLKVEVLGQQLLHWVLERDEDLAAVVSDDKCTAEAWFDAITKMVSNGAEITTHEAAKQVYWLVGNDPSDDGDFHLLQPMFASSLAHAVHQDIQDVRFGEANKLARIAFREKEPHESSYREYRSLAIRKFGGSKPQNVSQLNSERGGVNYLFSSLPPKAQSNWMHGLANKTSAIEVISRTAEVRAQLFALSEYLRQDLEPTKEIRDRRDSIIVELMEQIQAKAAEIQFGLIPGWTCVGGCKLPLCEQIWLDPGRVEKAEAGNEIGDLSSQPFEDTAEFGNWPDQVATIIANIVNAHLLARGIAGIGDAEAKHWAKHVAIDVNWPVPRVRRLSAGGMQ